MRTEEREAAYVEFVTARQGALRRLAYAVCGDWASAEEILDDALTGLYVAWPRLQREGEEETYVRRRIVRANLGRHGRRAARSALPRPALIEALQVLPPKQRKAVLLRQGLGLSVEATAEDLDTSPAAVHDLTERAAAALGIALDQEAP
jgi:DNA-directed RNA polymerase specialized sigma24 family protein